MDNQPLKKWVITAMLVALGLLLPGAFHMFGAGPVLLPMHLPVLVCGLACGGPFGAACGLVLPYLSSMFTSMPPLFPTAVAMSFELCAYGAVTGFLYRKKSWNLYAALITAMLCGRLVSGAANAVLLGVTGKEYGLAIFLTGAFVKSLPGIALQLLVVPPMVAVLIKARVVEPRRARLRPATGE